VIEQRAVVTETGERYAWLEIRWQSACSGCHTSDGCGTADLTKLWGSKPMRVRVVTDASLRPGDEVWVGMAEGALVRGALLVYLLPLVLLFAGALLGQAAFASAGEELVVLCGVLGLVLGLLAVRILSQRWQNDVRYQPVVLRPLATNRVLSLPQ
jgi:sigma-E factor negative regulatory protein RseC